MSLAGARTLARPLVVIAGGGTTGYATYKARTDPPHLFWDLDHTLLCSVTPLPTSTSSSSGNTNTVSNTDYFDQIDDDFPHDPQTNAPNTRTYIRPGARGALKFCGLFGVNHVFTAAQGTYTRNILANLDPDGTIFETVTHRDDLPSIVQKGKDLSLRSDRLDRAILYDDRTYNFLPQNYRNGIEVKPYNDVEGSSSMDEAKEMVRCVGIAFLTLVASDVRAVVPWFRDR